MPTDPANDAPHQLVGRYEPIALVASGAIGELWRARIASGPEQGRAVLLRRIPRPPALDPGSLERITNAGFAAMELRHPKIAAVLDVVVAEKEIGVVSEHINGALLQALVRPEAGKRTNVPLPVAVRIALDVLEAVDSVRAPWAEIFPSSDSEEERLVASGIHGGIVLDDLLIAHFGETMLLEAGLAGVALALPGVLDQVDAVAYRAPEQLDVKGPIDERADVFSVGAVLWELIAGRSLFGLSVLPRPAALGAPKPKPKGASDAAQASTIRRKVLTAPVQRLDTLPLLKGKIPKALADWVSSALERDRAARFPSVRAAIEALTAASVGLLGDHDAVSKLVVLSGVASTQEEVPEAPASLASNRPTVPPVQGDDTPIPAETPHAAVRVSRFESEPPTVSIPLSELRNQLKAEGLLPSDLDVESVPPTAPPRAKASEHVVESLPPSSGDVETLPPGPVDSETVRPFAGVESDLAVSEHTTFAAESAIRAAVAGDDAERESGASNGSPEIGRRAGNRKVVWAVMAAALLLALVGVLRVTMASHEGSAPPHAAGAERIGSPPETAALPPSPAVDPPVAASAAPAVAVSASGAASAPLPTLALPAGAESGAVEAEPPAKKPSKKTPYRPTGI